MITLSDGTTTLALPAELDWTDRNWSPVAQSLTRSVTGSTIIMTGVRQHGRPITLEPPADAGWWSITNEAQIRAWLADPEQTLTLTLRGTSYNVRWRLYDGDAYSSEHINYTVGPGEDHQVAPTFRFFTVEP